MKLLNKVPVNHRVLLHLTEYRHFHDKFQVPFDITQIGIADHVSIHRAAAARALNEMKADGLIISETKHVIRGNRNRKVYFLTYEGIQAAKDVEKSLLESQIRVHRTGESDANVREISEMIHGKDAELTLLGIANELKNGTLEIGFGGEEGTGSEERNPPGEEYRNQDEPDFLFSSQVPSYPNFAGRKEELRIIESLVTESRITAVVIQGIAGIGKTSLAAKAASTLKKERNVSWVTIHPWTGFYSFSAALFDQLEARPKKELGKSLPGRGGMDDEISHRHFENIVKETLTILKRSPRLIVIDDVHNANSQIQKYLRALFTHLSGCRTCTFLMTARTMPNFYDRRMVAIENRIHEITLSGLNFDDAFELVSRLNDPGMGRVSLGESNHPSPLDVDHVDPSPLDVDHVDPSPLDVDHVDPSPLNVDHVDSSPLDVDHAEGALLGKEAFGKVYAQTKGHPLALELISRLGSTSSKLDFERFLSEEIMEALSPEERTILEVFSVLRHPANMKILLSSLPDPSLSMVHMEILLKKNLIHSEREKISIHGLIKDFFEPRITRLDMVRFHSVAADYYAHALKGNETTVSVWNGSECNGIRRAESTLLREEEHSFVVERIYHLVHAGRPELAFDLIIEWADELISYGNSDFFEVLGQVEIEGVDEERRKQLLEIVGDAQAEFGQVGQAIESYVKRMEFEVTDPVGEARILHKIGKLEGERGDIDASIRLKKKSLGILLKRRDLRRSALMYNELGLDHWKTHQRGEARTCFHKAVDLLEESGERYALSRVLLNLAQLESEEKHNMEADSHLKESLKRTRTDEEKIEIYHVMGDFSANVGERKKAILTYQKGLKLAGGSGEYREMLSLMERLTGMYIEEGEMEKALGMIEHGIKVIEEGARHTRDSGKDHLHFHSHVRNHATEQTTPADPGKKMGVRGQPERHVDMHMLGKKRSRTQEAIRRDNYRFAALCETAESILAEQGESDRAADYLEKAFAIYGNFHDDERTARLLLRKGMHEYAAGKEPEAVRSYKNAFALYERIGDLKGSAVSLLNFTAALEKITPKKETIHGQLIRLYEKARTLSLEAGYEKGAELAEKKLGDLRDPDT